MKTMTTNTSNHTKKDQGREIYDTILSIEDCNIQYSEVKNALSLVLRQMRGDNLLINAGEEKAERFCSYVFLLEQLAQKMSELDKFYSGEVETRCAKLRGAGCTK
jgi:hypothetical protein